MLEKEGGSFVVYCDFCSDCYETGDDEFYEALGAIKREGWRNCRMDGEWAHKCPSCVDAESDASDDFEAL